MITFKEFLLIFMAAALFVGCQSAAVSKPGSSQGVIPRREMDALKSAAKAYSGRDVSDEDIYRLANQLQNNSEAQEATSTVTNALIQRPVVYYCPVDGKRFAPSVKECPEHHVQLKLLE